MIIKPHVTHPLEYSLMPDDQLFFLHIPKTAGTTLAGIMENVFNREEIMPYYFTPELIGQDLKTIGSYRYFRGHFPHNLMQAILPRRVVTITMLRKPVERFLSHVDQIKRGDNSAAAIEYLRGLSLEEMVTNDKASPLLQNFHVRMLAGDISLQAENGIVTHLKSHLTIQSEADGLLTAQANLAAYSFVGLTERFQESLFLLTYVFNWRPILDYPSLNVAEKRTQADGLDWRLLARIQALNQQDEEIYNQGAALFDVRYQQMTYELLEQYGTRAHARQKLPLAPEVMFDLLERRYEVWYRRTRTFVNNPDLSMNEGIQGAGWHPVLG